jgi:hypothetical protein
MNPGLSTDDPRRVEQVRAMLTACGVRAEIVRAGIGESSQEMVWVPAQDYVRATELVDGMMTSVEAPARQGFAFSSGRAKGPPSYEGGPGKL